MQAKEDAAVNIARLAEAAHQGDVEEVSSLLKIHNPKWVESLSPERKKSYE